MAQERREVKGKGERERNTRLNAEFQTAAMTEKKAFLNEQCKEIRKTTEWERLDISSRKLVLSREHFMQERARKSTENGKGLRKAQEMTESGKNTQTCTKNILMTWITTAVWSLT